VEKRHTYASHYYHRSQEIVAFMAMLAANRKTGVLYLTLIQVSQKEGMCTVSIQ
jgi:hypothetical protein